MVNYSYSMLLGRPWLRDAKVAHDWGSNIVTIQGNAPIRIIIIPFGKSNKKTKGVTVL